MTEQNARIELRRLLPRARILLSDSGFECQWGAGGAFRVSGRTWVFVLEATKRILQHNAAARFAAKEGGEQAPIISVPSFP